MPLNNTPPQLRNQPSQNSSGLNFNLARQRAAERAIPKTTAPAPGELFSLRNNGFPVEEPPEVKRSFMERLLGFTGGEKLAQGAGQALALPGTSNTLNEIQASEGEMQQRLIQAIRKAKAEGKDTTRLVTALKALTGGIKATGIGAEDLLNPNKLTGKQIVGDALQLATAVGTLGTLPGMAKNVVTKPGIITGAVQGAKTAAKVSGAVGTATGFSQGLKEDKSILDSAAQGLKTGAISAVAGGVLGGVVGAVSGKLASRTVSKAEDFLDNITPKVNELTPTEYEKLLNMGKIAPKTATKPARYILSENEIAAANKYKALISSKDPVKNTINVIEELAKKDEEVGTFLEKNNGIFNGGQLKNHILSNLDAIDDVTVDRARLMQANRDLTNNFIASLKKKDMRSLWQARKAYDKQIEKAFGGSPTLTNTIKTEFRNAIQDFISEKTPNKIYSSYMKDMRELFSLRDVLNSKATKEKTYSGVRLWIKEHPTAAKLLGWSSSVSGGSIIGTAILSD